MSTWSLRATVSLLALLLVATAPRPAAADKRPDYKAARQHFKKAQQLMKEKRYADAIVEFRKAYAITGDGLVMGQVALAYEKAGDYEGALKALEIYRAALPEADRGPTDKLMAQYRKAIAEGRSRKLVIPGEEAEAEKPKPAGTLMDAFSDERGGAAKAGDKAAAEGAGAAGEAAETQGEPAGAGAAPPATEEAPGRKRFWTWIALGTSGAMALSALVVGLNAQNKFDELESTCKPNCDESEVDAVRTRAIAADVLWGAAATALVTAGVLYFFEGRGGERPKTSGTSRRGLTVTPVVSGATFGLGARLDY